MQLLSTPAIEETFVRRVYGGFGDNYKIQTNGLRVLSFELNFLSCENAKAMSDVIADVGSSQNSQEQEQITVSHEVVPGEEGKLTNIRILVSTYVVLGRKALRLHLSIFALNCFRRNKTSAFYLEQRELKHAEHHARGTTPRGCDGTASSLLGVGA